MLRRIIGLTILAFGLVTASALANAPNPTHTQIVSEVGAPGGGVTVTVAGTWTWDQSVKTGAQANCNDTRVGVGYAVAWGDNTANNALKGPNNTSVYPGNAGDDWVHSVSQGMQGGNLESGSSTTNGSNLIVDGPFSPTAITVLESMTGKTADAVANGFNADSGQQGISDTSSGNAVPTATDAANWLSNCGPTHPKTDFVQGEDGSFHQVFGPNGQTTEGNSDPSNPTKGYPNGFWGPISHTYSASYLQSTGGQIKVCPVMYDPHGDAVGGFPGGKKADSSQITADANGDNSETMNGNTNACQGGLVVSPSPGISVVKVERCGSGSFTSGPITCKVGDTIDYRMTVTNTGNTTLAISFSDPRCDSGTLSGPVVEKGSYDSSTHTLSVGGVLLYTCSHKLTSSDPSPFTNTATAKGRSPSGATVMDQSSVVANKQAASAAKKHRKKHKKHHHKTISHKPKKHVGFTG